MKHDHRYYERQSALAAIGQLTGEELADLEQNAASCASCSSCLSDIAEMSRTLFLLQSSKSSTPDGMEERFMERAARAGICLRRVHSLPLSMKPLRLVAVSVLCVAAFFSWKGVMVRNTEGGPPVPQWITEAQPPPFAPQDSPSRISPSRTAPLRQRPSARRKPRLVLAEHEAHSPQPAALGFAGKVHWDLTCVQHNEDCRSEQRSFRIDPKLVSLAYLESPASVAEVAHRPNLKFTAPEFHLSSAQPW